MKLLSSQEELAIERYLERYAEGLVHSFDEGSVDVFESVIVVPIYDESQAQIEQLLNAQALTNTQSSTLLIWVFNAPESSLNTLSLARTQKVYKALHSKMKADEIAPMISLSRYRTSLNILLIDSCHCSLIPDKQGVGLARKLGMDLALQLIYKQYLSTQRWCSWIYSTDADVTLPDTYATVPPKEGIVACLYPFKHLAEEGFERAITEYEFSLHYYVDGLKRAGSPYAFHTIGSLIVVSSVAYAHVRGMPKRAGAEDFYLLNKLAKLGKVESLKTPCIELSGRPSHRVPFGTGPAVLKIQNQYINNQAYSVYHPRIFLLLHLVLSSVSEIEHCNAQEDMLLSKLVAKLTNPEEKRVVLDVLRTLGWQKQAMHFQTLKTTKALQHAFHVWFDAFMTLRFIHELRDKLYPNILLRDLPSYLAKMPDAQVKRGSDFDYIAWFRTLGI